MGPCGFRHSRRQVITSRLGSKYLINFPSSCFEALLAPNRRARPVRHPIVSGFVQTDAFALSESETVFCWVSMSFWVILVFAALRVVGAVLVSVGAFVGVLPLLVLLRPEAMLVISI